MVWFSKEKDHRLLVEFNACLRDINSLAEKFRELHADSVSAFEDNLKRQKTLDDLKVERLLFEAQFEVARKLKHQTDMLVEEAYRLIRNEAVFTEADRIKMKEKLVVPQPPSTVPALKTPRRKQVRKAKVVKKPTKKKAAKKVPAKRKPALKKAAKKKKPARKKK